MKKILRAAALLLLPLLLYYGVFLAFEPNNFFGLRAETPSGAVFGAIRQYQRQPTRSIIVGDSRLAHLDMDLVEEVSGRRFSNLAFGGASLKELLDLLEYTLKQNDGIDEVVLGISYYTLNKNYATDRFDTIERALNNPFAYLTSLSYNLEAIENLLLWLSGQPLGGGQNETKDPAEYQWRDYAIPAAPEKTASLRTDLGDYLYNIAAYTQNWQPNIEQYDRLLDIIDDCHQKGIRFVVVLPPMHPDLLQYDVIPRGIDKEMEPLLRGIEESPALLLDYELTQRLDLRDDQFFDGFHLDYYRGLPEFTKTLFAAIAAQPAAQAEATP